MDSKNTAEKRPVIVGVWVGKDWVIEKGLKPEEKVVTDGFMRLAPGMAVKIVTTPVAESKEVASSKDAKKETPP